MERQDVPIIGQEDPRVAMQKRLQQAQAELAAVTKQRDAGLAELKHRVDSLVENENLTVENLGSPVTVDVLRTLVRSMDAVLKTVDAQDKIVNMVINDLTGTVRGLREMQAVSISIGQTLEVLIGTLISNGVITEEMMMAALQTAQAGASQMPNVPMGDKQ